MAVCYSPACLWLYVSADILSILAPHDDMLPLSASDCVWLVPDPALFG